MLFPLAAVTAFVALAAHSHSTSLVVSVGDAANGAFIADAQVRLPSVGRVVRTAWNGEARLNGLADGTYRVEVRAIGYAPSIIDVRLSGDTSAVFFQLERGSTPLDTVRITGRWTSPRIAEFESRRAMGIGRFLTDSILAHDHALSLQVTLATRIPGVRVSMDGKSVASVATTDPGKCMLFYLDGFKFDGDDLDNIRPTDLAGVEVYGAASAPVAYRPSGRYCKVVLLWSRW